MLGSDGHHCPTDRYRACMRTVWVPIAALLTCAWGTSPAVASEHNPDRLIIRGIHVSAPDPDTGAVRIRVDARGNGPLDYDARTSLRGIARATADGRITFVPTVEARHQAAREGSPSRYRFVTVLIRVTDAHAGEGTVTVRVPVSPSNATPVARITVGPPDASTGAVVLWVDGMDADGDRLRYAAPTKTDKGTVRGLRGRTVLSPSGTFTYTPTATARHAAAAPGSSASDKQDTFTVTVSDGYGGEQAVPITVPVLPGSPS